jgi:hypothetical protein
LPNIDESSPSATPESVEQWLKSLGLEKYLPNFEKQEISIALLPYIDTDSFDKMGVTLIGPRMLILREVRKLARL